MQKEEQEINEASELNVSTIFFYDFETIANFILVYIYKKKISC